MNYKKSKMYTNCVAVYVCKLLFIVCTFIGNASGITCPCNKIAYSVNNYSMFTCMMAAAGGV